MNTSNNLLHDSIAALHGTHYLACLTGMSRRSVPCILHLNRPQRFLEAFM